MASSETISINELQQAISQQLEDYTDEVAEKTKKAVQDTANECLNDIEELAPKRTGAYSKSWKAKKTYEDPANLRVTVHSPKHYRLAHLLEHGHMAADGTGFVQGKPHLSIAEEKAAKNLEKTVMFEVKKIT